MTLSERSALIQGSELMHEYTWQSFVFTYLDELDTVHNLIVSIYINPPIWVADQCGNS